MNRIAKLALLMRSPSLCNTNCIRYENISSYKLKGSIYKRALLICSYKGCSVPTCSMCPLPNSYSGFEEALFIETICKHLDKIPLDVDMLSIYNDGSYYSDREFPEFIRKNIEEKVKNNCNISLLNIESLPNFITSEKIEKTLERADTDLLVNIGIQTFNEKIRCQSIGSPFNNEKLFDSIKILKSHNVLIRGYLLFKPPFLDDEESIRDLVKSIELCRDLGIDTVSINPCKVCSGTVVSELYRMGLYEPPHLFSVFIAKSMLNNEYDIRVEMPGHGGCNGDVCQAHLCVDCDVYWRELGTVEMPIDKPPLCWITYRKKDKEIYSKIDSLQISNILQTVFKNINKCNHSLRVYN